MPGPKLGRWKPRCDARKKLELKERWWWQCGRWLAASEDRQVNGEHWALCKWCDNKNHIPRLCQARRLLFSSVMCNSWCSGWAGKLPESNSRLGLRFLLRFAFIVLAIAFYFTLLEISVFRSELEFRFTVQRVVVFPWCRLSRWWTFTNLMFSNTGLNVLLFLCTQVS